MSLTRLVLLASRAQEPSPYLVVDGAGMIVTRGTLSGQGAPPPFKGSTLLVIPGMDVTTRWIKLKAASADQARAAAAMMLQDDLAQPREDLHFALGAAGPGGQRPVSVISKARLLELLDQARALGVVPDAVVPDHLMLAQPDGESLLAASLRRAVAVRGRDLAFTAEPDLVTHLANGRALEAIEDPARIESLFASVAAAAPVNLLLGAERAGARRLGSWRRVTVLASLALASPLLIQAAYIARYDIAAGRVERATAAKGDTRQLVSIGASMRKGRAFSEAMAIVFKALERLPGAKLQSLSYRSDGTMRATVVHDNYSDVATLAGALGASGLALREDGSSEAGGRISTDLTLTRAP